MASSKLPQDDHLARSPQDPSRAAAFLSPASLTELSSEFSSEFRALVSEHSQALIGSIHNYLSTLEFEVPIYGDEEPPCSEPPPTASTPTNTQICLPDFSDARFVTLSDLVDALHAKYRQSPPKTADPRKRNLTRAPYRSHPFSRT